jgi:HEAT repeat protein
MLSLHGVWLALAAEGALILAALGGLVGLRLYLSARARQVDAGVRALEPILHRWLLGQAHAADVGAVLRGRSAYVAFRSLARLAPATLTFERQQILAPLLRREAWVARLLVHGRSRLWWRRFDVARLLSIVGGPADAPLVEALLRDRHPAVRLVAIDAAARLGGRLIETALDELPRRQDAVQQYLFAAMGRHPAVVAEALTRRLQPDAEVAALNAWIDASGALASPDVLDRVRDLANHTRPEVRLHVARALRRHADPDTAPILMGLLADEDWRVRAQAARALGALRAREATSLLALTVCDPSWWVRYRSALALAQIGGESRDALLAVARGDDPMARDMALLVSGLSSAAVVEMSEV